MWSNFILVIFVCFVVLMMALPSVPCYGNEFVDTLLLHPRIRCWTHGWNPRVSRASAKGSAACQ